MPSEATGKTWAILIDNDINGDNGYVKIVTDICSPSLEISYFVNDVPKGTYFLYAAVFVVSDGTQGPQIGNFFGIYGGQYPDNIPIIPNAKITSGTQTFNIDLAVYQVDEIQISNIALQPYQFLSF